MRPLDWLPSIKVKLGVVIVATVVGTVLVLRIGARLDLTLPVRVLLATAIGLLFVQVLARGTTSPLREMAAAATAMARGDHSVRVRATSRDEVGELARAFNTMAAQLADVDRQRRDLVANVSHELRTPIGALQALLENLADGVEPPDPATLRIALAQTERLGRLVAQLLDLSRMESGALPLRPVAFPVRPLLEEALRERELGAPGAVRLKVSVQPGDLAAHGDPERVHQVVANLLDNAIRHSPPEGRVWLSAHADDGDHDDRGRATRGRASRHTRRSACSSASTAPTAPAPRAPGHRPRPRHRALDRRRARRRDPRGAARAARLPRRRGAAAVTAEDVAERTRPKRAALAAAAVPAWFALAAVGLAAVAALALPGHPAGLGLALVGTGVCASVAAAAPGRDAFATACWVAAAALAAVPVLRAAGWVVVLSLLAAFALAAVAAGGARTWREIGAALATSAGALVPGALLVLATAARRTGGRSWRRLGPVARGAVLAAVLLAVFVPLLVTADAAFAELLDDLWSVDVRGPPVRPARARRSSRSRPAARCCSSRCGAARARAVPAARAARPHRVARSRSARSTSRSPRSSRVQLTTLFGGHRHVLETAGLTYAEYARSGFVPARRRRSAHARRRRGRCALGRRRRRAGCRARSSACCACSRSSCSRLRCAGSASTRTRSARRACGSLAHVALLWLGARVRARAGRRRSCAPRRAGSRAR